MRPIFLARFNRYRVPQKLSTAGLPICMLLRNDETLLLKLAFNRLALVFKISVLCSNTLRRFERQQTSTAPLLHSNFVATPCGLVVYQVAILVSGDNCTQCCCTCDTQCVCVIRSVCVTRSVCETEKVRKILGFYQARSQVSRFGGTQYIFRGARFLLLLYV